MTAVVVDTLVLGGGVAGLWTLRELLDAGIDACLVENAGLGGEQSMQVQGIVHGGGKYALRRVGDVSAIRQIREMPERWREHRAGRRSPSLADAHTSSEGCWLWLPAASWLARLEALTLIPLLRHGGVLATPPQSRPKSEWPLPLQQHALRAYRMDEPVLEPVSVISALAGPVGDRLLAGQLRAMRREADAWELDFEDGRKIRARAVVACAGTGNAKILELAGQDPARMQRRPLRMGLVRGDLADLPALHGHCVIGGRTRLTITSVDAAEGQRVWQVGGELAERWASTNGEEFFGDLWVEIQRALPGLDLSRMELADYPAVRAEAANTAQSRPSGVQVDEVAPSMIVAWPTKWAMAPLLAEEVAGLIVPGAKRPDTSFNSLDWPRAGLARPPWERAEWRSANSARPA
ncbi:hypothetical protein DRQ32_08780 [bacterium]|nr:MAG: hypothetical protein DRQ32_08780 [bacterium]